MCTDLVASNTIYLSFNNITKLGKETTKDGLESQSRIKESSKQPIVKGTEI